MDDLPQPKTNRKAKAGNLRNGFAKTRQSNAWPRSALPVGQYSVFVVEKEGLYANYFNGKGSINPIEVLKDSLINKDIIISNHAAF
ncbi:MAG: hypothetical protein EOP42_20820 [Sphingobacteriaceae bacterium]|nr:MAG: hypothetical protein EOP42_20820 [Sphingobacteriaceae bacterium]